MASPRSCSRPQSAVSYPLRTFGFRYNGDGVVTDPHRSSGCDCPLDNRSLLTSSGSRHWGFPTVGIDSRPPAACSPRNSSVPCHGQVLRTASHRSHPGRWTLFVHRVRVATLAIRLHRSLAAACWQLQPLAGFMTEAHQYQSFAPRRCRGDAAAANQFCWLLTNPKASSPPQPNAYPFMRMPCSPQRPPDRAECSSRPAPACGPPS